MSSIKDELKKAIEEAEKKPSTPSSPQQPAIAAENILGDGIGNLRAYSLSPIAEIINNGANSLTGIDGKHIFLGESWAAYFEKKGLKISDNPLYTALLCSGFFLLIVIITKWEKILQIFLGKKDKEQQKDTQQKPNNANFENVKTDTDVSELFKGWR
jgi:hypothetical protein